MGNRGPWYLLEITMGRWILARNWRTGPSTSWLHATSQHLGRIPHSVIQLRKIACLCRISKGLLQQDLLTRLARLMSGSNYHHPPLIKSWCKEYCFSFYGNRYLREKPLRRQGVIYSWWRRRELYSDCKLLISNGIFISIYPTVLLLVLLNKHNILATDGLSIWIDSPKNRK